MESEMQGEPGSEADLGGAETRALIDGGGALEGSFIELVVAVSECSEDEGEIIDRVDALLASGRVHRTSSPDREAA